MYCTVLHSLVAGSRPVSVGGTGQTVLVVRVSRPAPTATTVSLTGLLSLLNLLADHLELRLLPPAPHRELRCLVGAGCRPASVLATGPGAALKVTTNFTF